MRRTFAFGFLSSACSSTHKKTAWKPYRFTKAEIIRCLKRLLARELWAAMRPLRAPRETPPAPLDRYRSINAAAESFFSTLEWEVLSRNDFTDPDHARTVVLEWCHDFYNSTRRHTSANMMSPINFETASRQQAAA